MREHADNKKDRNSFLDELASITVDIKIVRRAGTMLGELCSRGKTIGIVDDITVVTALEYGVPLLASNIAHYPFHTLTAINDLEANSSNLPHSLLMRHLSHS